LITLVSSCIIIYHHLICQTIIATLVRVKEEIVVHVIVVVASVILEVYVLQVVVIGDGGCLLLHRCCDLMIEIDN
jgi:hypothetical protein